MPSPALFPPAYIQAAANRTRLPDAVLQRIQAAGARVDSGGGGGGDDGAGARNIRPASFVTCTTCDADCDIFEAQVPPRVCRGREQASLGIYCGVPSQGAGRVVWAYKKVAAG